MAAPAENNPKNLTGKWVMNKTLSKDFDPVLSFQGIGWMTRTIISKATITVAIKTYPNEEGIDHVDVIQTLTGGITSTPEHRVLDWKERAHSDSVFGDLVGRTQYINSKELLEGFGKEDIDFLGEGWDNDVQLQSWVENKKAGWTGNQVWGFQIVEGERRYVRKASVRKGGERKTAFLVYDYAGPNN